MPVIDLAYVRDAATGQVLLDGSGYPQLDAVANATANTSANLVARIQNEVLGSPTTTDVQNAVLDAIHKHDGQTFYFNKLRIFGGLAGSLSNLQTSPGKEFYSNVDLPVLLSVVHISKIMVVAWDNRYTLSQRTPQWIDDQSISTSWESSIPTDWCIMDDGALRLYPIPSETFPLILDATIRFPDPAWDLDYSCWTNRGEALIRHTAKMLLFRDIIRDEAQAQVCEKEVYGDPGEPWKIGELRRLKAEGMRRAGGSGKIRPSRGYL